MKCNWKTSSLLAVSLVLCSFQQRNATYLSFEKFITEENKMAFATDSSYYIVVEPKMCTSCNVQALRVLSAYAGNKPLYVFCDSSKRRGLSAYVKHKNVKYITRFDYKWVSKQIFMRSGVAFALSYGNKLRSVEVINGTNLKQYE